MSNALRPYADELGYPGVPVQWFVEKSGWEKLEKQLA